MSVRHRELQRHHEAFEAWYDGNRSYRDISLKLGIPNSTLRDWGEWFSWDARADARDAEASRLAEREAIKRRAAMLLRHRQAGQLLVTRGTQHFTKNEIEKASDAVSAIRTGAEMERTAEGLPTWLVEVMNADARTVEEKIAEMESRRRQALAGALPEAGDPGEGEPADEDGEQPAPIPV